MTERGLQVSIMGDIYKSANRVLVWPGEYSDAKRSDLSNMRRPHFERSGRGFRLNTRGQAFVLALNEAIASREPRWYDRAWIVQEFSMAREVIICFGPISCAYDAHYIAELLVRPPEPLEQLKVFHARTDNMRRLKLGLSDPKHSISDAALFVSTAACSNPRDRVYSLLSLIDSREAQAISSDYQEPCEETFARATFAAIKAQKTFKIFELINFDQPRLENLPTWAVDFTMIQNFSSGHIHQRRARALFGKWTHFRRSTWTTKRSIWMKNACI